MNHSGSKYLRAVPTTVDGKVDVYAVLDAFIVTCPGRQHAIKKLLCSGLRGKADELQDLEEARDAITRAIQMFKAKYGPGVSTRGEALAASVGPRPWESNQEVDEVEVPKPRLGP